MEKKVNPFEKHFESFMKSNGFNFEKIPELNVKTPDYNVIDCSGYKYIIEVTSKLDDETFEKELLNKGFAESVEIIKYKNSIAGKISYKNKQLTTTESNKNEFKIIWVYLDGSEQKNQAEQLEATLLGRVDIVTSRDNNDVAIPCYFFNIFEFKKRPELDGVFLFLTESTGGMFLINPFSEKYNYFKKTELYKLFDEHKAILDPLNTENSLFFIVNDFDLSRKNENDVLDWVKKKYNLKIAYCVHWHYVQVAIKVNKK